MDIPGASEDIKDAGNEPKKLHNASELEHKRSERRDKEDAPGRARPELDDPDDEADASAASGSVEDVNKSSKKLWNTTGLQRKHSEQGEEDNSPSRP